MSALDAMLSQFDAGTIERMAGQLGASPEQTRSAIQAALPMLMGAMQRNAATPEGAESLHRAVTRDHQGVDLGGLLGGLLGGSGGAGLGGMLGGSGGAGGGGLSDLMGAVFGAMGAVSRPRNSNQHRVRQSKTASPSSVTCSAGNSREQRPALPAPRDLTAAQSPG